MTQQRTPQPCGCVIISEPRPLFINDVDMSGLVSTVVDMERCADHQREWDAHIQRFADHIDRKVMEAVMRETR